MFIIHYIFYVFSNHIIGCSLWERFATDLHEFIEKEGHHDISVILQFAKVKIFHGT